MRALVPGLFLFVAVLFPRAGNAQVYQFRTPEPEVTAASAAWQINASPVIVDSVVYFPTRGFRQFDGQVMAQVGIFEGVPVYADTTLEPYTELYVPVGGGRMRSYERRGGGPLRTTSGFVPSFPVGVAAERAPSEHSTAAEGGVGRSVESPAAAGATRGAGTVRGVGIYNSVVGTIAAYGPSPASVVGPMNAPDLDRPAPTMMQSIPRPNANDGVWLALNGVRWYSDGPATSFSSERFEPAGEYRGFPVYRDRTREDGRIWVTVVMDGPVAPYAPR